MFRTQFAKGYKTSALAHAIVDTVREPLLVLDHDLRVVAASRSFYTAFTADPHDTPGTLLYELSGGEWDIPNLRMELSKVLPEHRIMENCEFEHFSRAFGRRTMRLNAREVLYEKRSKANILLMIEDVTTERNLEREKDEMLRQKDILLGEVQHRIGNSLQLIANIILLKARSVDSEEIRTHLTDAHDRVVSIAAVQHCLSTSAASGQIELGQYFSELCEAISIAMVGDHRSIGLNVSGEPAIASCREAESLGLILTELVINALKHAFKESTNDGRIAVAYAASGAEWKLTVADDGVGIPVTATARIGIGTSIIKALAKQLGAGVTTLSGPHGTTVSVTRASEHAVNLS
jgi:chemotaxis protein methyltransferase CheR